MKQKWFACFLVCCMLVPALFLLAPLSSFAEETPFPTDEQLVQAIQTASGGFDPENPDILMDAVSLDLSGKGILSLEHFEFWNLGALTTLNLSNNRISELKAVQFSSMPNLKTLIVSNNVLSTVNLVGLQLQTLALDGNAIASITLNCMADEEGTVVNLSSNQFSLLSDVTNSENIFLPTVFLNGNSILVEESESIPANYELMIQGARNKTKFVESGNLRLFESMLYPNLVALLNEEELTVGATTLSFGRYEIAFLDGSTPLDNLFPPFSFSVVPPKALIQYEVDGQLVEHVELFEKGVRLLFSTNVPSAQIFFRINSGEWTEGNELNIRLSGNFNITVQVRVNGVASDNNSVMMNIRLVKPFVFFLGFLTVVAFLAAGLFLVYYYQRSRAWKKR